MHEIRASEYGPHRGTVSTPAKNTCDEIVQDAAPLATAAGASIATTLWKSL